MGASNSKNSSSTHLTNMLNLITNIMSTVSNQASGSQTTTQSANLNISGSKVGSIGQDSSQTINIQAMLTNNSQTAVQDQISTALSSYVNQQSTAGGALLNVNSSSNKSETYATSISNVATNIKLDTIQKCMSSQVTAQELNANITNSEIGVILQSASQAAVQKCIMENVAVNTSLNSIATNLSASTSNTSTAGFDLTTIIMYVAIACVALAMIGVSVKLITSRRSDSNVNQKALYAPPITTASTASIMPSIVAAPTLPTVPVPLPPSYSSAVNNNYNTGTALSSALSSLANPETLKNLTNLAKLVTKV